MGKILWIDLEMSGLNEQIHAILELAAIVTDYDFKNLGEFHKVVYQPQSVLDRMDDWCVKTHGASGLTHAVATGMPLDKVEVEFLKFLDTHFDKKDRIVLAGNSVGNDRRFIDAQMPKLASRLHYRIIDVSSWKEVFREKYRIEFKKKNSHRAVDDIHESINELKLYLSHVNVRVVPASEKAT